MKVTTLIVSKLQENTYFYFDENTKVGVVVDPGGEEEKIIKFIDDNNLDIKAILITHGHFDHILAVNPVREHTGCDVVASKEEMGFLSDPNVNLSKEMAGKNATIVPNILLNDGETYSFNGVDLKMIHTPGHTPGGSCFYSEKDKLIFVGDTLFYRSVGRSDFYLGDENALKDSIKNKLYTLPDDVKVYCGHGMSTTIGSEKINNPYVKAEF